MERGWMDVADGNLGFEFQATYGRLIWVRLINPRLTLFLAITVIKIRQIMEFISISDL